MAAIWNQARRLYVAEFKCGVIKVGITSHPMGRLGLSFKGRQPARFHYCEKHDCGFWAERQLLERMRRIATVIRGREYFVGVRFGLAKLLANQVTRQAHAQTAAEAA